MKTTLVFGASLKPHRISHQVVTRLRRKNFKISAFGVKEGSIDGVQVKTNLEDLQDIDTVTLYISPKNQPSYYTMIIGLNPRRVIFNPGTENQEFYNLLTTNDIEVEVACTLTLLATNQY